MTHGTRFRLFPKYREGYREPETITVSLRPGTIGPGPSDPHMHVVHPVEKDRPYDPPHYLPPYRGAILPPATPSPAGHFDHIEVHTPQFHAAHLYGAVRATLDIWERYLGHRIVWWHAVLQPQLELIPRVNWDNAQSGLGFVEMGLYPDATGQLHPFSLNCDVIAHEVGHAVLFSQIGVPDRISSEFLAFHEAFSDLTALLLSLHFNSVTNLLMRQTGGNLYVLNLVNRFGAISHTEQLRVVANTVTMDDVAGLALRTDGNWFDPLGQDRNAHHFAAPLTGAVFDILVELYQDGLVSRRLVHPDDDARGWTRAEIEAAFAALHGQSARAYARFSAGFHHALQDARDALGRAMAVVMTTLPPEQVSFARVAARLIEALASSGARHPVPAFVNHFLWRGIDPRPFLHGSAGSGRRLAVVPHAIPQRCNCRPHAFMIARGLIAHAHRAFGG